jgi:alanine-alpha-ketoisovalerate/valine-pyruvate aminotransferase
MKKTFIIIGCVALLVIIITRPISGLNSESIVRLKEAGVSGATIQVMIREKTVETAAFSVQEIIDLKKAGFSEKTIQMLIQEGSFLKDTAPVVYGKNVRPIEFTTAQDIIELKKAGITDEVIQAIIRVAGNSADSQRQQAYDLLEKMKIWVDLRDRD